MFTSFSLLAVVVVRFNETIYIVNEGDTVTVCVDIVGSNPIDDDLLIFLSLTPVAGTASGENSNLRESLSYSPLFLIPSPFSLSPYCRIISILCFLSPYSFSPTFVSGPFYILISVLTPLSLCVGDDYTIPNNFLALNNELRQSCVEVDIVSDNIPESTENLTLTITNMTPDSDNIITTTTTTIIISKQ